jgi:hypothetical protein
MQTAAIPGQRSACRNGDDGAERRDAILSWHPKAPITGVASPRGY